MGKKFRLNQYLSKVADKPFKWGEHDCFTFTNNAWKAMYGHGWADDWVGLYMLDGQPMRRDQLRKTFKFSTFEQGLKSKLIPSERPVFGSLVTTKRCQRWVIGSAMGISVGSRCVFLSKTGLIKLSVEDVESCWVSNVSV
jgi:hypothetical protein